MRPGVGIIASSAAGVATVFPTLAATNTEVGTAVGTANAIPSPTGILAGHLLLASVSQDSGATVISASTGWTIVDQQSITGAAPHRLAILARIADGGANDALAITGSATEDYCASILRITGHGVTNIAADIKFAFATSTASAAIDSPSLDAGSSRKWLWLSIGGLDQTAGGQVTNTPPASYTLAHSSLSSAASASSSGLGVAYRTLETQTENPGVWSNALRPWIAYTLAIPPA